MRGSEVHQQKQHLTNQPKTIDKHQKHALAILQEWRLPSLYTSPIGFLLHKLQASQL